MNRIVLAAIPEGMVTEADFRLESAPEPAEPGVLVRTTWLSVDPYLRGRMTGKKTYIDPIPLGAPMISGGIGEVLASDEPRFAPGDIVTGMFPWQERASLPASSLRKLDPAIAPVTTALGILGMPGMTAYFGLTELCAPKPGETVVVSGAAGAVGSAAGQIAKILGCRVFGTAGSDEKCDYLLRLGFDGAMNYRREQPWGTPLRRMLKETGVDCYFDNVGGDLSDAVFELLNVGARVALCGQISQYNDRSTDVGPRQWWRMIVREIRAEGFLVLRWNDRWGEGVRQMATWLREGKLSYEETIYEGLDSAPRAFIGLFTGENTGKALVRL